MDSRYADVGLFNVTVYYSDILVIVTVSVYDRSEPCSADDVPDTVIYTSALHEVDALCDAVLLFGSRSAVADTVALFMMVTVALDAIVALTINVSTSLVVIVTMG